MSTSSAAAGSVHVLLVSGEAGLRRLLLEVLNGEGYAVEVAGSAPEALACLDRAAGSGGPGPVLILVDFGAVGADEVALAAFSLDCRRRPAARPPARGRPSGSSRGRTGGGVSILLLTTELPGQAAARCLARGVDGALCLPLDVDVLLALVRSSTTQGRSTAARGVVPRAPQEGKARREFETRRRELARLREDLHRLREALARLRSETHTFLEFERTRPLTAEERRRRTQVRLQHEGLELELHRLYERFEQLREERQR
ncbi:MAG TPA: hypothetical protein VHS99_11135, partial [Chloroflexota bacterium]|nr:hypothetical protein [Chloroflexota bacterium]